MHRRTDVVFVVLFGGVFITFLTFQLFFMTATIEFKPVSKKYSIDYYFKGGAPIGWPDSPSAALAYYLQHGEWPFNFPGNGNLIDEYYTVQMAYQKRRGVYADQFFTSPKNCDFVIQSIQADANSRLAKTVLDACAGFGMLSSRLLDAGYEVTALERDWTLPNDADALLKGRATIIRDEFQSYEPKTHFDMVVSNPPFSGTVGIEFLQQLPVWLAPYGMAWLILPVGFIDKPRPASLVQAVDRFQVESRTRLPEGFEHTKIQCELVQLRRIE